MGGLPEALHGLVAGFALGVQPNPLTASAGAVGAAMLAGYPSATVSRRVWASCALLAAWLLGDGFRVMARLSDALASPAPPDWPLLAGWALAGLALGYALPAWAGAFVGTRVVRGTGWLSAGVVALTAAGALGTVSERAGAALAALAG